MFAENCNSFGPRSNNKIDQVIKEGKRRGIDGIMTSLSDTRCRTIKKFNRKKLKSINFKIMLSMSDSKEEFVKDKSFSKGGTQTSFWNDATNHMKLEERAEKNYGLWRTAIIESRRKRLAIMTMRRIIDTSNKSVNSCKAQHERKSGKVKRAKDIRTEMLQELKK